VVTIYGNQLFFYNAEIQPIMKEKDDFLKKFGKQVRKIRKSKGLSIREIELNHDVTRQFISNIELGKSNFTFFNLKKLSDCLEVELDELFKGFKK
jgi:transcriptional regulator with XRE-family HTH domain